MSAGPLGPLGHRPSPGEGPRSPANEMWVGGLRSDRPRTAPLRRRRSGSRPNSAVSAAPPSPAAAEAEEARHALAALEVDIDMEAAVRAAELSSDSQAYLVSPSPAKVAAANKAAGCELYSVDGVPNTACLSGLDDDKISKVVAATGIGAAAFEGGRAGANGAGPNDAAQEGGTTKAPTGATSSYSTVAPTNKGSLAATTTAAVTATTAATATTNAAQLSKLARCLDEAQQAYGAAGCQGTETSGICWALRLSLDNAEKMYDDASNRESPTITTPADAASSTIAAAATSVVSVCAAFSLATLA